MKRTLLTFILVAVATFLSDAQSITEIHYDNDGGDVNEGVEVYIPANYSCGSLQVIGYNGNGGASYDTNKTVSFVSSSSEQYVWVAFSGLQNGSPDGVALVCNGMVIEFLSYEGTFTAVGGPADGMTSTDIGVTETNSTPVGKSLQLVEGTWGLQDATPNAANPSPTAQPVTLTYFDGNVNGNEVNLSWETAIEINNDYFAVEHSTNGINFDKIAIVEGYGNTNDEISYDCTHTNPSNGLNYYRLKQVDFDGGNEYHGVVTVTVKGNDEIVVYPTAVNEIININVPNYSNGTVSIVDALGNEVLNQALTPSISLSKLMSGFYTIKVSTDGLVATEKIVKL